MAWIEAEIVARGGAIPFRDFMDIALYHPEHGYYSAGEPRWGRDGDFLTAPTASRWYVSTISRLVLELSAQVASLEILDVASGDGTFLASLWESLKDSNHSVRRTLSVEKSEAQRRTQEKRLRELEVVRAESVAKLSAPVYPRVVHASELYDAFPVHRVVQRSSGLHEQWVAVSGHGLVLEERLATAGLQSYIDLHGVVLAEDQIAELDLDAEAFHRRLLASSGDSSIAVILDYGYQAKRLYDPRGRAGGSLACYKRHQLVRDPLCDPGEQDITAHVNWDDLRLAAGDAGWSEIGLWTLTEFLGRAGIGDEIENAGLGIGADLDAETLEQRQEIKRLLDPEGMGSDLKVLVQGVGELGEIAAEVLSHSPFGSR
jgi:SAM-dependent MidA family methyltransferase